MSSHKIYHGPALGITSLLPKRRVPKLREQAHLISYSVSLQTHRARVSLQPGPLFHLHIWQLKHLS